MAGLPFVDRLQLAIESRFTKPFQKRVLEPLRRLRNARREYRPIFIAGASGSGTSFLAVALGQRFDCAGVVYELDSQLPASSFLSLPSPDSFPSVSAYQTHMSPTDAWSVEAGRDALLSVFRSCSSGPSDVVIAKGPDINLFRTHFLARCFPDAHFVLVFRDPVANIEGLRRKWPLFGGSSLEETIRFYRESHERFATEAEAFPGRITAVAYEALVERPEATLDAIAARCQLTRATTQRRLQARPNQSGKGLRNVQNSSIGVVKDANRKAIERMDPSEADTIRKALAPLRERLCSASFSI